MNDRTTQSTTRAVPWAPIVMCLYLAYAFSPLRMSFLTDLTIGIALTAYAFYRERVAEFLPKDRPTVLADRWLWSLLVGLTIWTLALVSYGPIRVMAVHPVVLCMAAGILVAFIYGQRPAEIKTGSEQATWRVMRVALVALPFIWLASYLYLDRRSDEIAPESVLMASFGLPTSIAVYLPLAVLRNYLNLHVLRSLRRTTWCRSDGYAILITACLFGLAHAPVWELMAMCCVVSVVVSWTYLRLQRWAPALLLLTLMELNLMLYWEVAPFFILWGHMPQY